MKIMTPQDAAILRGRPYDKIISSLQKALVLNQLYPLADSTGKVLAVTEEAQEVIPFTIPIQIFSINQKEYICVDLRKANREYDINQETKTFKPKLMTESNFLVNHALIQSVWQKGVGYFNNILWDAGKLYANWCGTKVAKRLGLDLTDRNKLIVGFAYFFYTRGYAQNDLTDNEYLQIVNRMSMVLNISLQEIGSYLSYFNRRIPNNLDELCDDLRGICDNPKMKNFNRVVLQAMLIGSWLGLSSRELVALAAEYPPTFITMVYRGLNERSFKDTDITQVALQLLNSTKQKQFNYDVALLLKQAAEN